MRLGKRAVDMGDVADAEGDRIGVEAVIREAELFRIRLDPGEAVEAALLRPLAPHLEHLRVDVGDGYPGAALGEAEGDVAGAAGWCGSERSAPPFAVPFRRI